MPSAPTPVTVPLTLIAIAPPPELVAAIPPPAPLISLPFADWVKEMPPIPPVCDSTNAVAPAVPPPMMAFTAVSSCSVTESAVAPLAERDCVSPILPVPEQVYTPEVDPASHSLSKPSTRSNVLLAATKLSL